MFGGIDKIITGAVTLNPNKLADGVAQTATLGIYNSDKQREKKDRRRLESLEQRDFELRRAELNARETALRERELQAREAVLKKREQQLDLDK